MARVTQADVDAIEEIKTQATNIFAASAGLQDLMVRVLKRIELTDPLNADADFEELVAKYRPLYDDNLRGLKELCEALPRWDQA